MAALHEKLNESGGRVVKRFTLPRIIIFAFLCAYVATLVYAFGWTILSSLKADDEYLFDKISLPKLWRFRNYIDAFNVLSAGGKNMFVMIFDSLWFSLGTAILNIMTSALMAYAVARFKFFGRGIILGLAIFTMMLPIFVSLPATYALYNRIKILDSPFLLIAYMTAFGSDFLMLHALFKNISQSYADSAYLDGAGHMKVMTSIMFPQASSLLTALIVISFVAGWNNYMDVILFLPSYPTLMAGLYVYQIESARQLNYPVLFAGLLMSMLPILAVYIGFQEKFMSLDLGGGLKG